MCVCHITRWLVVIWLIVSLVHLQANALLQYSAAELLKLRHHVPAPLQPPERGHDIPPGIAFQPRRRYVHRGSRHASESQTAHVWILVTRTIWTAVEGTLSFKFFRPGNRR
uniref:Secreted protein n=1 Tax=Knipowitschia caucasica TaxID=637954 RepID=A0AAV2LMG5_KNICA